MSFNFREKFLSSRAGQIGVLLFSAYTFIWSIVEPMNFEWINSHKTIWRIILLALSGIITLILSLRLTKSILEKLDANGPSRTLQGSYSSKGNPQLTLIQDGELGNVINIKGDFSNDELDWIIKSSAQQASILEVTFKHNGKFDFYLRVGLLSKNGEISIERWLRFDSTLTTANPYVINTPELGVPYTSVADGSYDKAIIKIKDAVKQSYGQDNWVYHKILLFRIRCYDATIKSVVLKK